MTAGTEMLHRSIRASATVNWRRVFDRIVLIVTPFAVLAVLVAALVETP